MCVRMGVATDKAEDRLLLFAVGTDSLEGIDIGPEAAACGAFADGDTVDREVLERAFAAGAFARVTAVDDNGRGSSCTAMSAEFAAEEHQPKAFRAADGLQTGAAKFALRTVAHHGTAAVWAIESFGLKG